MKASLSGEITSRAHRSKRLSVAVKCEAAVKGVWWSRLSTPTLSTPFLHHAEGLGVVWGVNCSGVGTCSAGSTGILPFQAAKFQGTMNFHKVERQDPGRSRTMTEQLTPHTTPSPSA